MQASQDRIPETLPLLPLKDIVVFPQMILPVFISEEICMKVVEAALAKDRFLFLSAFRVEGVKDGEDEPELAASTQPPFDIYDIGTVALVMRTRKLPDGRMKVLVQGISKARVKKLRQVEPYPFIEIKQIIETTPDVVTPEAEALMRTVREQLEKVVALGKSLSPDILMLLEDVSEPGRLADLVASNLGLKVIDAQRVLALTEPLARLRKVHSFLSRELEVYNMQVRIQSQAKEEISRAQREHYLREQLKAIRHELGELDGKEDIEELREKVMKAAMSKEGEAECLKQVRRLERMHQDTSEATITRTYVEWMVDLPWAKSTDTAVEMHACKKILDEDHYGLEKVKDRILEYIAVQKLNPQAKGPILCFSGPPGVGKTSLGKSIARSLGRKFVRISLGGVRDEAEIRGHRRTYVGAQPGRIIQALKNVSAKNAVIMLDEIDKLGADYKGDPSSALLEVLDPEQNHAFSDHYIAVPFDLSQVIFLANANRLDTIPPALRDRLEIIEVAGYSEDEKFEIAKTYLIPKCIKSHGLLSDNVLFQDSTLNYIINGYTRESGLRNLEKQIASVTRKLARSVAEGIEQGKDKKVTKVTPKLVRDLLGDERYLADDHDTRFARIGVSTGLAYTPTGGEVLELEVHLFAGKGILTLTGQMGDVMKESVQTALSFLRSRAREYGMNPAVFAENDIHVHIPAGAIPKDGPSAGIALAAALASAFLHEPLRQDVAMTGEITLHGKILPIGGLREKLLAALRVGIKTVCVPERNKGSIAELPLSIRRRINIRFVSSLDDVFRECFEGEWFKNETRAKLRADGARSYQGPVTPVAEGVEDIPVAS
jgi:ATP-dependent Lon protease